MSGGGWGVSSLWWAVLPYALCAPSCLCVCVAMYVPRMGAAPSPVCSQGEECGCRPSLPLCVCASEWYALPP